MHVFLGGEGCILSRVKSKYCQCHHVDLSCEISVKQQQSYGSLQRSSKCSVSFMES